MYLRQIFLNIYGNCIKYNRIGGKIITVSDYTEAVDGITTYEWTITDTGIIMCREYQKHIFEPFSQEREDARSTQQGIGLGMAIVKFTCFVLSLSFVCFITCVVINSQ